VCVCVGRNPAQIVEAFLIVPDHVGGSESLEHDHPQHNEGKDKGEGIKG
jgi:hypothetical protein